MSIPLIKICGATGAAIGTAISLIIGNIFFMNWYYHNRIGINMIEFWVNIVKFLPALVLPSIIETLIMQYIEIGNIFIFILAIIIYTLVYSGSFWVFGMNPDEKNMIKGPIKRILKNKK